MSNKIRNIAKRKANSITSKEDYLGSSIKDENHLALYVKDTIDDVDASNETTFRRWLATMIGNGMPID